MTDEEKKRLAEQAAAQATPPAPTLPPVQSILEDISKVKKEEVNQMEKMLAEEAKLLGELSQTDGWKVYKKYVSVMIDSARNNITPKFSTAIDLQQAGLRWIIADQIMSALKDALDIVDLRRKEIEVPTDDNPTEDTEKKEGES